MKKLHDQIKKLQEEVISLNESLNEKDSALNQCSQQIINLEKEKENLKERNYELKKLLTFNEHSRMQNSITIDSLNHDLNNLKEQLNISRNPETMTVMKGIELMIDTYNSITCPVTRKEVFKEFIHYVMKRIKTSIEKARIDSDRLNDDIRYNADLMTEMKQGLSDAHKISI